MTPLSPENWQGWPTEAKRKLLAHLRDLNTQPASAAETPKDWYNWLQSMLPGYIKSFAPHHVEFWQWVWALGPERPRPFIGIWPRGGGKSTSAEAATVAMAAHGLRSYAWYIRATQDQADNSVDNIMSMLESSRVAAAYPLLSAPARSKYGNSRGWRRNRLRTAAGVTIDALGLDTAVRGARVEEDRPGLIIFDDIDEVHDTPHVTEKKITTLTTSVLPAMATNAVVMGIQNLIIPHGIFSRLAKGTSGFLQDAIISGPHPAVRDLTVAKVNGRDTIISGDATWDGQNLETCQHFIDDWGLRAFMREAQHAVDDEPGGMFDNIEYKHCKRSEVPDLIEVQVWVDPAVTSTDGSHDHAIQVDGMARDKTIYRLHSWHGVTTPEDSVRRAILLAQEYKARHVGIETDQGGDTWISVVKLVSQQMGFHPREGFFLGAKAGMLAAPKTERAGMMLTDYERGSIIHVLGTHNVLEDALFRFPKSGLDMVDVAFWCWWSLRNPAKAKNLVPGVLGQGRVKGW